MVKHPPRRHVKDINTLNPRENFLLLTNVFYIPMKSFIRISFLSFVSIFLLAAGSCAKKDETCTAVIKVVGVNGTPANGARVTLTSNFGLGTNNELATYLPAEKLTDLNGLAEFTFRQPAILDIEVTHITSSEISTDLIKLEVGKTVSKTITLQ